MRNILLECKKHITDADLLKRIDLELTYFSVVLAHRDDLVNYGYDGYSLDDEDMQRVANEMNELMAEKGYNYEHALQQACEIIGVEAL